MDQVSFCRAIPLNGGLWSYEKFALYQDLRGENPLLLENLHFLGDISFFTTDEQAIKGNLSKKINVREMGFLQTDIVQPHHNLKEFD